MSTYKSCGANLPPRRRGGPAASCQLAYRQLELWPELKAGDQAIRQARMREHSHVRTEEPLHNVMCLAPLGSATVSRVVANKVEVSQPRLKSALAPNSLLMQPMV